MSRGKPILDGRTYIRIGSIKTGKIVIYPIEDNVDGKGNQLINWTTEAPLLGRPKNDWNKPGRLEDFLPIYESWRFDWLDVLDQQCWKKSPTSCWNIRWSTRIR